jgi:hypothetical protein
MNSDEVVVQRTLALMMAVAGSAMAVAAQTQIDQLGPDKVRLATYAWLFGFSLMGWLASDAPKLAGWVDRTLNDGNLLKTRLEIVQGFVAAELAGVCVYFLAKSSPKWLGLDATPPEMTLFVFVGIAGFAGTRGLEWVRMKFFKPQ